jgi:hypothetical protein
MTDEAITGRFLFMSVAVFAIASMTAWQLNAQADRIRELEEQTRLLNCYVLINEGRTPGGCEAQATTTQ